VTGNTVVITGGSQGVGRAAALVFARNRYNVVIAARNPEKLAAADAQLGSACARADAHLALSTDITDAAAVQRLVDAVTAKFEMVTTLINCAGGVFVLYPVCVWHV
jgi:NAD(P)-dependent dehydrogenase (short-subunit alcohol dehydrogenase family)